MEVLFALIITIVIFLVFRAIVLWYWRINEIADTLSEININIAKLAGTTTTKPSQDSKTLNQGSSTIDGLEL